MQSTWSQDVWYHVVFTWQDTTLSIYVDGELNNTAACTSGINSTANTIYLGNHTTANVGVNGAMDEVRVYDRALSATEVKLLYDRGR